MSCSQRWDAPRSLTEHSEACLLHVDARTSEGRSSMPAPTCWSHPRRPGRVPVRQPVTEQVGDPPLCPQHAPEGGYAVDAGDDDDLRARLSG
jgi:hypothetical protein